MFNPTIIYHPCFRVEPKFFYTVVFLAPLMTLAQTEQGAKLVGVNLSGFGFSQSQSTMVYPDTTIKGTTARYFSIGVGPTMGWFLRDNLAIGGSVSIHYTNNIERYNPLSNKNKSQQFQFGIIPFIRYYFNGNNGKPFFEIYTGYSSSFYNSSFSSETSSSSFSYSPKNYWSVHSGLILGYEYYVNNSIGLYASTGFNYSVNSLKTVNGSLSYISKYTSWTIPLIIGLQIHLTKKQE